MAYPTEPTDFERSGLLSEKDALFDVFSTEDSWMQSSSSGEISPLLHTISHDSWLSDITDLTWPTSESSTSSQEILTGDRIAMPIFGMSVQSLEVEEGSKHPSLATTKDRPRTSCHICGNTFSRKYDMRRHARKHDKRNSEIHSCPFPSCREKPGYTRKDKLLDHLRARHCSKDNTGKSNGEYQATKRTPSTKRRSRK